MPKQRLTYHSRQHSSARNSSSTPETRPVTPKTTQESEKRKPRYIEIDLRSPSLLGDSQTEEETKQKPVNPPTTRLRAWKEHKKDAPDQMHTVNRQHEPSYPRRSSLKNSDRTFTVFRLGDTDPTPLSLPDTGEYSRSYKRWKEQRSNMAGKSSYENHICEPQTYEEWMDKKEVLNVRRQSAPASSIITDRNKILLDLTKSHTNRPKSARRVTWKQ